MKILKPAHWFLLFVVTVVLIVAGCSKSQTDHKLIGRWDRVYVEDIYDTANHYESWEFVGSEEFRIYYNSPGGIDTTFIPGNYHLDSYRDVTLSGSLSEGFPGYYSGKWRIIKLKKDALILTKQEDPGGLLFREFVKL